MRCIRSSANGNKLWPFVYYDHPFDSDNGRVIPSFSRSVMLVLESKQDGAELGGNNQITQNHSIKEA